MASHPAAAEVVVSPVSLRHGVRCVPVQGVTVEDVLLVVGELIGYENISSASRMNKAVVVFVKEEELANRLISEGIVVGGDFLIISPLVTPTTRITVSNVPPFIQNDEIERALVRYGKLASGIRTIPLRCRNEALKHVMSFRRQVFMFLNQPELDVSFRVGHEGKSYVVYANTGSMKCFECGDIGHKRMACPHKAQDRQEEVAEHRPSVVAEDVQEQNEEVQTNTGETNHERVLTQITEERNVVHADLIDSNDQRDDVDENEISTGQNDASKMGESSVMTDDVIEGKTNVGMVQIDDPQVFNSVEMRTDSEMGEDDNFSEISDIGSQIMEDTYTLQEINDFLDATFGKTVEVKDFFPDIGKFIVSVTLLQRNVSHEVLSKQKRFRLRKILTKLRKSKANVSQND